MATANYTVEKDNVKLKVIRWNIKDAADEGQAYTFAGRYPDKCVQVIGTVGSSGNLKFQGCNEATPTNWDELHDTTETLLDSVNALGFYQILENPANFRPLKSAGTGMDLIVLLCMSK